MEPASEPRAQGIPALPEAPRLVRPHEVAPWWARLVIAGALGAGAHAAVAALPAEAARWLTSHVLPFALAGLAALAADLDRRRPRAGYLAGATLWGGALTLVGAALVTVFWHFRGTPFEFVGIGLAGACGVGSLAAFLGLRALVDGRERPAVDAFVGAVAGGAVFALGLAALRLFEGQAPPTRWWHPQPSLADLVDARRAGLFALALAAGLERAGARPPLLEAVRVNGQVALVDERVTGRMRWLATLGRGRPGPAAAPEDDGLPFEPLSPEEVARPAAPPAEGAEEAARPAAPPAGRAEEEAAP